MDLDFGTVADATRALRHRQVSSRELLEHQLGRIERYNPACNAVVALDVDRARSAATAADEATAAGELTGPLHGLPITVKDVWETEGLVTTAGAPSLATHVPTADALAVARLKAAGAIVVGKTNTPLYAGDYQTYNDVYGRTGNPWDTSRTTGGSSGGAAAAVAAGLTPLELGSDIGGSIRIPAHYTGVYGLKPSWGIVPTTGHIPPLPGSLAQYDVSCAGPLTRSVGDLRTALDVIAGPAPADAAAWQLRLDPGPPIDDVRPLRVATVFDQGVDVLPLATDVRTNLEGFATRLADAGARVDPVSMPVPLADGLRSWQDLVLPIIGAGLPEKVYSALAVLDQHPDDPVAHSRSALAARYRSWARADERRQAERAAWACFFESYDVLLAPVMPTAAFAHDTDRTMAERTVDVDGAAVPHVVSTAWCGAIGSALLPVVTLPTGPTRAGLPVGVQVIGPFLSDLRLLAIAELLDAAAGPGFTSPPAIEPHDPQ